MTILILSVLIYLLFLLLIILNYKGLINSNNKIIRIVFYVFLVGGLFYFIYNSIYISNFKDNIWGIIFFSLALLLKFIRLIINKQKSI